MQSKLEVAAERLVPTPEQVGSGTEFPWQLLTRTAVGQLAHGTMTYECDTCGFHWRVWLALGVEGPQALRDARLYVPAPFTVGSCPAWPINPDATEEERAQLRDMFRCPGRMAHVRFSEDERFGAPRLMPDEVPRFVLDDDHAQGRLSMPTAAMVAARRWHREQAGG